MKPGPQALLDAWECAQTAPPVERATRLLSALEGELTPERSAGLPLGARDARLLRWREQTFGSQLHCLADCPACRASVEFSVDTEQLHFPEPAAQDTLSLADDGWRLSLRLPDTADLSAAAREADVAAARRHLFARCLVSATSPDGANAGAGAVPDELICAAGERMARADPLADLTLALRCPDCAATWEAPFDGAGLFCEELRAWSARLLGEIHVIASAYGWSESEILALSPARRHAYLDLIRA